MWLSIKNSEGDSMMGVEMIGCENMNTQQLVLGRFVLWEVDSVQLIITPVNGGLHSFPIGVGSVLLTLGPDTKGQSSKRVDVPLEDSFVSGTSPHYWDGLEGLYSAIQLSTIN
jgi:hypothetical protein